jgi:hypothetical protein
MCDGQETSREHVPAACFFPERKDLPTGVDLRRNLFTVPSCDAHNSHKSKDDQYLWHIITAARGLNECGEHMARTKVRRSVSQRPALIRAMMRNAVPTHVYDPDAGEWQTTLKVRFDLERFNRVADHLGRALYFLHFCEKWGGVVEVFPSFTHWGPDADKDSRRDWRKVVDAAAEIAAHLERIGDNQPALYYQVRVVPPDGDPGVVMRATFYGGPAVTFGFLPMRATIGR